ncbi:DUF5512 family protein [Bacillus sp. AFS033286]|uniref:DUF5512 family protein n=1 Tax=Bacillus sp. AFS033286 TaxID=2033498 RepID=UPI000BFDCB71|nr:DUF5512 family protein [Bacillus sp. AFS033286]PGX12090.1 hypothetical protein COE07_11060 [Bacillus sp. AFS033286]
MFKNMKLLSVLFICMTVLLAGCGGTSLPYKKGETYKEQNSTFIEVKADDEWKINANTDRSNEYALYKVKQTDLTGGQYSVIEISVKQKFGNSNPMLIMNDYEYFLIGPTEKGFALWNVGTSHPNDKNWKKFKEKYEKADDKEAFLKKEAERPSSKFEKTN